MQSNFPLYILIFPLYLENTAAIDQILSYKSETLDFAFSLDDTYT